jgi:EmrB/QacA subfamily drug resistance transporter
MSRALPTAEDRSAGPPILLLLIVAVALFMENLDSTVVATALPAMARSLGEAPLTMSTALTAYLLSLAIFIPSSGWLADRFGAREVFIAAIALFTLGSLLCGLSRNLPELIAARVLQGMGGAITAPTGRLVLLRSVTKAQLVRAMSYVSITAQVGTAIGPLVGGFFATYLTWRWIFFANLPIGLIGMALALPVIPRFRVPDPGPADIRGLVLGGVGLSSMMLVLDNTGHSSLPGWMVALVAVFAVLILALFTLHGRSAERPAIDFSLLRLPTYRASLVGGSWLRLATGGAPFLLPLMFQLGFGLSPLQSGSLTFATAIGAISMKAFAPSILQRFGFRRLLLGISALFAAFMASYGLFRPSWPYALIIGTLFLGGLFRALTFTCVNAIGYADVLPERMSGATTLSSAAQKLALSTSVALAATSLALLNPHHARGLAPADFLPVFLGMGLFALFATPMFGKLPENAGAELSRIRLQPQDEDPG